MLRKGYESRVQDTNEKKRKRILESVTQSICYRVRYELDCSRSYFPVMRKLLWRRRRRSGSCTDMSISSSLRASKQTLPEVREQAVGRQTNEGSSG